MVAFGKFAPSICKGAIVPSPSLSAKPPSREMF